MIEPACLPVPPNGFRCKPLLIHHYRQAAVPVAATMPLVFCRLRLRRPRNAELQAEGMIATRHAVRTNSKQCSAGSIVP